METPMTKLVRTYTNEEDPILTEVKAWLLLKFGDERQHAGNDGYADQASVYEYDSNVPNHKQIAEKDYVIICAPEQIIGIARIEKITSEQGEKILKRCPYPSCKSTKIQERAKKKPPYYCTKCRQEFEKPIIGAEPVQKFKAYYGNTFIALNKVITIKELREVCLRYNKQLSMQLIDLDKIKQILLENGIEFPKLLNATDHSEYIEDFKYLKADDSDEDDYTSKYIPTKEDSREIVFQQIRKRRGQSKFRNALRQRYGEKCMISGCQLIDILEAAHISPYRGADDNHPENGLLLRSDLHTLFDLDLLGINPDSLKVELHPKLITSSYQKFVGRKLICAKLKPSKPALEIKWLSFCRQKEVKD